MINNERLINPGYGLISETLLDHQMPVPMDSVLDDVSRKSKTIDIFERLIIARALELGVDDEETNRCWNEAVTIVNFIWEKTCSTR